MRILAFEEPSVCRLVQLIQIDCEDDEAQKAEGLRYVCAVAPRDSAKRVSAVRSQAFYEPPVLEISDGRRSGIPFGRIP